MSQALTACQRRWPVRDRELYAVVWCLRKLPWLRGATLTCYVDHESLATDSPEVGGHDSHYSELRWAKWTEELLQHNISFHWSPGATHVGPDGLSRHAGPTAPCKENCVQCGCAKARLRDISSWEGLNQAMRALKEKLHK